MPSVSRAQHNLFAMVAHDPEAAARLGISHKVARDFVDADKGRNLKKLPKHVRKPRPFGTLRGDA